MKKKKKAINLDPALEEKLIDDLTKELTKQIDNEIFGDLIKQDKLDRLEKLRKKL